MVFEYRQTLLYCRAIQPVCRTRPNPETLIGGRVGRRKGDLSVYFPCSQFTELARPILSLSPLSLICAPDSIFPGEFFPSFGKRLLLRVSPPQCNGLCFPEANGLEPLYKEGGIGKNFYEIIRSSREFVKGMGSGRGEGEREDGMGRSPLRGDEMAALPPGNFLWHCFLSKFIRVESFYRDLMRCTRGRKDKGPKLIFLCSL